MKKLMLLMVALSVFANEYVTLNFKNLKISDFINMVAKIEHKNILISSKVNGKINFISVKPVKKSNLFDLLIAILKTKGYTLVKSENGYLEVVKSAEAIRKNPFLNEGKNSLMKVKIIHLKNLDVNLVAAKFRRFLSRYGNLISDKAKNDIIIIDYQSNINSFEKIIKSMDIKGNKELELVKLKYIKVRDIYIKLKTIANNMFDSKILKNRVDIITDENSNTLVLIGNKKNIEYLKNIVKKFDVKEKLTEPFNKVVFVKNSEATEIVKILSMIYGKKKYKRGDFKPQFTINRELNAIVVIATPIDMKQIENLINSLDIEKPQVYVKALILEVSKNKIKDLGTQLGVEGGISGSSGLYTMAAKLGGPSVAISSTIASSLSGNLGTLTSGLALGATLHLLNTYGASKVLSEPSLICLNNKASTIYIGSTVSVLTSAVSGSTSTSETKNSYKRENIGLTLKVKPRISSDNKVALDVALVAEEAKGSLNSDRPITSKRQLATNAIVKSGESVILGGLSKQTLYTSENKVPLLGDIPVLGYLFKYHTTTKDDTDLMILITPYIINKSSDLTDFKQKLAQYQLLQSQYNKVIDEKYKKGELFKNKKIIEKPKKEEGDIDPVVNKIMGLE